MKPNHICKNRDCTKGTDGGRKHYYACDDCDRNNNKRAVSCCDECFVAYMQQVAEARISDQAVNLYPERTDKSENEVKALYEKPVEDVHNDTMEQLAEYKEDIESNGLAATVDLINKELDEKSLSRRKKTSK